MADSLVPAVTVIDHDPEVIGRAAAERLFRRLEDLEAPAETVVVPVRLVPRGSGELRPPGSAGESGAPGQPGDDGQQDGQQVGQHREPHMEQELAYGGAEGGRRS
jgi:LacI family transcriptional regulator